MDREKSASWTISCELRGLFGFCSFHFSYADYRGVSIGACSWDTCILPGIFFSMMDFCWVVLWVCWSWNLATYFVFIRVMFRVLFLGILVFVWFRRVETTWVFFCRFSSYAWMKGERWDACNWDIPRYELGLGAWFRVTCAHCCFVSPPLHVPYSSSIIISFRVVSYEIILWAVLVIVILLDFVLLFQNSCSAN